MSSTITDDIFSKGNTAVITGASSGIGKAAALEASKRGMHVWLIDVDESDLESAVQNVKDATICNEQVRLYMHK
jgi:short-subunit dehydrogenase